MSCVTRIAQMGRENILLFDSTKGQKEPSTLAKVSRTSEEGKNKFRNEIRQKRKWNEPEWEGNIKEQKRKTWRTAKQ